MCTARCLTLSLMRSHYERYHKTEEKFHVVCQAKGCLKRYYNFEGYKTHLRRKHQRILNSVIDEENGLIENGNIDDGQMPENLAGNEEYHSSPDHDDDQDADRDTICNHVCNKTEDDSLLKEENVRKANAELLLGIKEIHKLSQKTVDTVISNTNTIVQNSLELLERRIISHLGNSGVKDHCLQEFFEKLMSEESLITNPFLGMETKAKQDNVFKQLFGFVVCIYHMSLNHDYLFTFSLTPVNSDVNNLNLLLMLNV